MTLSPIKHYECALYATGLTNPPWLGSTQPEGGLLAPYIAVGQIVAGAMGAVGKWVFPAKVVSEEEEVAVRKEVANVSLNCDGDIEELVEVANGPVHDVIGKRRYVRRVVAEARVELGRLKDTAANRLVAERVLRKIMVAHGVRPTHVSVLSPVAVEMFLAPNQGDILAARIRASRAMAEARASADGWGHYSPTSWLPWLGPVRRYAVPNA